MEKIAIACITDGKSSVCMSVDLRDNSVSLEAQKRAGHKIDRSHDIIDIEELPNYLVREIMKRSDADLSWELQQKIDEIWAMATDIDPWYAEALEYSSSETAEEEVFELERAAFFG